MQIQTGNHRFWEGGESRKCGRDLGKNPIEPHFSYIFSDFAKALRMPTVIVRPASLRIYRNSTVRYATQ